MLKWSLHWCAHKSLTVKLNCGTPAPVLHQQSASVSSKCVSMRKCAGALMMHPALLHLGLNLRSVRYLVIKLVLWNREKMLVPLRETLLWCLTFGSVTPAFHRQILWWKKFISVESVHLKFASVTNSKPVFFYRVELWGNEELNGGSYHSFLAVAPSIFN